MTGGDLVYFLVISIHALREEGDMTLIASQIAKTFISIHALREEGDQRIPDNLFFVRDFYPRPPRGGRLRFSTLLLLPSLFLSTPSARRATRYRPPWSSTGRYFYPRPPRGGRR